MINENHVAAVACALLVVAGILSTGYYAIADKPLRFDGRPGAPIAVPVVTPRPVAPAGELTSMAEPVAPRPECARRAAGTAAGACSGPARKP